MVFKTRGMTCYTYRMTDLEFEDLVRRALMEIPDGIQARLSNVDLVVEYRPSKGQLVGSGIEDGECLLGLYEGIPLTERYDYDMVLPDKITLFQEAIEEICSGDDEVIKEVRDTVIHEIAHHFGIDDERIQEMEA